MKPILYELVSRFLLYPALTASTSLKLLPGHKLKLPVSSMKLLASETVVVNIVLPADVNEPADEKMLPTAGAHTNLLVPMASASTGVSPMWCDSA